MNFFSNCACCEPAWPPRHRRSAAATSWPAASPRSGSARSAALGAPAVRAQAREDQDRRAPPFPAAGAPRGARQAQGGRRPNGRCRCRSTTWTRAGSAPRCCRRSSPAPGAATTTKSRKLSRQINEYGAKLVQRSSRPLRPVRHHHAAGHRRQPEGDRIRLRHAQGRRHRPADELRRQISRRRLVRAGLRGAQPPQGGDLRAPDHAGLLRASVVPGIPPGSIEYATDSTRTIAHLVFSGMSQKYPDIRWIFSHSGGTLPFLTAALHPAAEGAEARASAERPDAGVPEVLLRAGAGQHQAQLAALFKMVDGLAGALRHRLSVRDGAEVNDGIAD